MKNVCFYICFLLCSYSAFSQDPNNHWRFYQTDLDFSTNPFTVTSIATNGHNSSGSSISDANGDLLFYCNENGVYNRNNMWMTGYSGVASPDFSQASIILPHPGDMTKFFVFFAENFLVGEGASSNYSYYNCVLVDFNNNPLGEIISVERLKDENGVDIQNVGDQRPLTYTTNAAGNGYWVIVDTKGKLLSYQVTASGVNAPVVGYTSSPWLVNNMIRIVPDYSNANNTNLFASGSTSATGQFYDYYINRFTFNKTTGLITNKETIISQQSGGFEFSNDYSKIYFLSLGSPGTSFRISVKDLTSLATTPRILYEFVSPTTISSDFGYIQKDKYGNLLLGGYKYGSKTGYIHKIENPESFSNSSVRINYVYLNGEEVTNFQQLNPPTMFVPGECIYNVNLTATETKTNYTYSVDNAITTSGNYIVNSGTITFKAGEAVYLKPNTHLKTGSTVNIKIEECVLAGRSTIVTATENSFEDVNKSEVQKQSFVMYPNPANTYTTISIENNSINTINVTSIEGMTMFNQAINKNSYELYVANYKPGIYIVTIQTQDGKVLTEKLMKN